MGVFTYVIQNIYVGLVISPEVTEVDLQLELEGELNRLLERLAISPAPAPEKFERFMIPSSPEIDWG